MKVRKLSIVGLGLGIIYTLLVRKELQRYQLHCQGVTGYTSLMKTPKLGGRELALNRLTQNLIECWFIIVCAHGIACHGVAIYF